MSRMPMSQTNAGGYGPVNDEWWLDGGAAGAGNRHRKPGRAGAVNRRTGAGEQPLRGRKQQDLRAGTASRMLMYATLALAMLLMFAQIGRLAQIAGQTKRISSLTSSIRELQNEKNNLQVRLSMQQNINRVYDVAVYKLGMVRPDDAQIRVVSLNNHSVNALTQTADRSVGTGTE